MRYIIHFIGDLNTLHGSLPVRLYQHYEGNHHTSSPVRCHLRPHHRYELGHIPVKLKESGYVRVVDVFQAGREVLCMGRFALYRALGNDGVSQKYIFKKKDNRKYGNKLLRPKTFRRL